MKKLLLIISFFIVIIILIIMTKQVIKSNKINTNVEIKLSSDSEFYTDTKPSKNLNTIYILVNKNNYLDKNYIPKDLTNINSSVKLVNEAAINFIKMSNTAKKRNLTIYGFSGYRSYDYQYKLYNKYVEIDGLKKADTYSARPGYSEHQTGLAVDVTNNKIIYTEFDKTDEFIWMKNNSYKFGFILRYPIKKEKITGYQYESWHYRYVGLNIASYINKNSITFDEYYNNFIKKDTP